ncbi:hypothetical protein D3C81_1854420 [compost metagenome]
MYQFINLFIYLSKPHDERGKEGVNAHIAYGRLASGADAGRKKPAEGAGAVHR